MTLNKNWGYLVEVYNVKTKGATPLSITCPDWDQTMMMFNRRVTWALKAPRFKWQQLILWEDHKLKGRWVLKSKIYFLRVNLIWIQSRQCKTILMKINTLRILKLILITQIKSGNWFKKLQIFGTKSMKNRKILPILNKASRKLTKILI